MKVTIKTILAAALSFGLAACDESETKSKGHYSILMAKSDLVCEVSENASEIYFVGFGSREGVFETEEKNSIIINEYDHIQNAILNSSQTSVVLGKYVKVKNIYYFYNDFENIKTELESLVSQGESFSVIQEKISRRYEEKITKFDVRGLGIDLLGNMILKLDPQQMTLEGAWGERQLSLKCKTTGEL